MAAVFRPSVSRPAAAKFSFRSAQQVRVAGLKPVAKKNVCARGQLSIRASAVAAPVELAVKTFEGEDKGTANLALKTGEENANGIVHKYLVITQINARQGNASTLTRSEVRGGGKKPMAQKGSGRARMGSRVTPLKPGGGILFGPKPKDWNLSMNKKERRLAMGSALQSASGSITVVEDLDGKFAARKTKVMQQALARWGVKEGEKTLLVVKDVYDELRFSGRNIKNFNMRTVNNCSIYDVLDAENIIVDESSLAAYTQMYGEA